MTPARSTRLRKYISLREKLAAALAELLPVEIRNVLRESKAPAKQIIELFEQDHNILHALGGEDRWWNLTPLLKAAHREKSRRDTSIVAKTKRISRAQEEFRARMLLPDKERSEETPRSRWGGGRKIMSRNSFEKRRPT